MTIPTKARSEIKAKSILTKATLLTQSLETKVVAFVTQRLLLLSPSRTCHEQIR